MRILVVDDHEVVRKGVVSLLVNQPDFSICGEAVDGVDAINKAKQSKPDVIVMDISMPKLNGLEATRQIRSVLPETEILVLSQHDAPEMIQQAFRAGARGYVMKSSIARDLVSAIATVRRHEFFGGHVISRTADANHDPQEIIQRSAALEQELRESEERFRLTFEQAAVGIAHVAENGRWLRVNQKLCSIIGYTEDELRKLNFQDITHPEDLAIDLAQAEKVAAGELDEYSMEKRYIRKDGRTVWINLTVGVVRDSERRLKYFISVIEDVTERKRTEDALRESEDQLRSLAEYQTAVMNNMVEGLYSLDAQGLVTSINPAAEAMLGWNRAELLGKKMHDLTHYIRPDGMPFPAAECPGLHVLENGVDLKEHEDTFIGKNGTFLPVVFSASPLRRNGNTVGVVVGFRDDSEQRKIREQLRESEQRFREMIAGLPAAVYTTDTEGRIIHYNSAAVDFAGRIPDLNTDRWTPALKLFRADGTPLASDQCPMAVSLKEGRTIEGVEIIAERPDGTRRWYMPYPRTLTDARGRTVGAINMLVDITERKKAEQADSLLAAVVDCSDDAIVSKNLDGVITSWNRGAERLFGYSAHEAIGRHISLIVPAERREEEENILKRLRQGERIDHFETIRVRKDGIIVDISLAVSPINDATGQVIGVSKVARDIGDRKRTEKVLATGVRQIRALLRLAEQLNRAKAVDDVYRAALDAILVAAQCDRASILLYDETGVMRFVSWCGLSDAYRSVTEGHSPWKPDDINPTPICMPDLEDADLSEALKGVIRSEGIRALAFIPLVANGKLIGKFMTYFNVAHSFSNEEIDINLAIARQLAIGIDRGRSEEALRESEEHFRAIVETTPECVKLVAADGTLLHMNSSGMGMVGADSADAIIGKNVYDLIAPEDRDRFRDFNERICRGEKSSLEFDLVGLKGVRRHMETHGAPLQNPHGKVVHLAVTRDITQRKHSEKELKRSEERFRALAETLDAEVRARTAELEERNSEVLKQSEQLRELSAQLMQTQDQERQRIARELHDSAGQLVTALGLALGNIAEHKHGDIRLAKDVEDSQGLVQQLSQEIRIMSYLLHPPLLDENGLSDAVRWYIEGLKERSGLDIQLSVSDDFGRLPQEMELALFRIVQECLTNVHRHSDSKNATIRISRINDNIALEVEDNGKGIPAEKLAEINGFRSGVGITGMRERVRHFGGTIQIHSNTAGTKVSVAVSAPLASNRESDDRIEKTAV
jgi:PAS domain S-box-containing protein